MYVQLDIGWLRHPFPVSSFRVNSTEQIGLLQSLGMAQIRCIPAKSDPGIWGCLPLITNDVEGLLAHEMAQETETETESKSLEINKGVLISRHLEALAELNSTSLSDVAMLKNCDHRFSAATVRYQELLVSLSSDPEEVLNSCSDLVAGYIADLLDTPQTAIRLLSESVGELQGAHPINVTVLSLLLGKAYGLNAAQLMDLGLAALLHDVGKKDLDPRCTELSPHLTPEQQAQYEGHVGASVAYGLRMGLSPAALTAIAQHHESGNGSGFPLRLLEDDLSIEGQILALTNCYDKLCNPSTQVLGLTPHEALSALFAQKRGCFARELIDLFVRLMGVYPPGSVIQLSDESFGLVVSVRSDQPLKPAVVLCNLAIPRADAVPVELSSCEGVVIRRSLRPAQVPREVLDYLSPRRRVCYFFARAVPLRGVEGAV